MSGRACGACSPLLFYFSLFPFCPPLSLSLSLSPPPLLLASLRRPVAGRRHPLASMSIRAREDDLARKEISARRRVFPPPSPPPRIYPFLADPSVPSSRSCRTVVVDLKRARVSLGPACDGFSIKSRNIPQPLCSLQWRGEELGQVANGNTLEGGSLRALACCGTMRAAGLNDGQV
jgi:hypothetical protein